MRLRHLVVSTLLGLPLVAAEQSPYVWIEGESAESSTFAPNPWYSDAVKKDQLSGGAWLTTYNGPAGASARWNVELPTAGAWTLWLRANPIQAGLDWRVDEGAWQAADTAHPQGNVNIANDNKPDLRFVAWMKGGVAELTAGRHVLEVRTTAKLSNHAAIDAMVFAAAPFTPNGKNRPGVSLTDAAPGWFAFDPGIDPLRGDALLDLRGMNEGRAGERGRIAARGDDLVDGAGNPLRLWAVNAMSHEGADAAQYLFGRLAKTGVNCARFHGLIAERNGKDPLAVSATALDHLHYNVKAAADHGVHVLLSTYFPLWLSLRAEDGIEGAALGKHPFGLLLFEPRFQALYKAWAKQVLTSRNPYTGKTLAEDPAVAVWEIQNEDSLFFWTATKANLGEGPYRTLGGLFATWAAKRHGSLEKALAIWGEAHGDDDAAAKRLGLYGPWETTGDGFGKSGPGKQARIRDQVRFLAEQQRTAYAKLTAFLRSECGFKGLVSASNWTTADNRRLGAIERWSYLATDLVDRHGYFGGEHKGDAADWSVRAGQTFKDKAAVLDPADTPLGYLQLAGRPHLHTEIAWNKPNRFVADGPLLIASYAALQGVDGFFGFAAGSGAWAGDGGGKWPLMMPGTLGQFPAAALQFRRGDVAQAPVVVRQVVPREDLLDQRGGGVIEGRNADFRENGAPRPSDATDQSGFDPLSYYAGRVERVIAGEPGVPAAEATVAPALAKAIDRPGKAVASVTGELRWDWGHGVVTVDSPRSQGVTGFLAAGKEVRLHDVTIASGNEYGAIQVISLDGQPLASAKRILIQAFSEERMYGSVMENGKITDTGRAPINVREIKATVAFKAAAGLRATALDGHGYAAGPVAVADGVVTLPKDRLYVIVTR